MTGSLHQLFFAVLLSVAASPGVCGITAEVPSSNPDSLAAAIYNRAVAEFRNARLEEGLVALDSALSVMEMHGLHEQRAYAENDRVRAEELLGADPAEVIEGYLYIDTHILPKMKDTTAAHVKTWYNLAMWYDGVRQLSLAFDYLKKADAAAVLREEEWAYQRTLIYNMLSRVSDELGAYEKAKYYTREAIALREARFGPNSIEVLPLRISYLIDMIGEENAAEIQKEKQRIEELFEKYADTEDAETYVRLLRAETLILEAEGKHEEALEAYARYAEVRASIDPRDEMYFDLVTKHAAMLSRVGRAEEALAHLRSARERLKGGTYERLLNAHFARACIEGGKAMQALHYAGLNEADCFPEGRSAAPEQAVSERGLRSTLSALVISVSAADVYADSTGAAADREAVLENVRSAEKVFAAVKRRADVGELIRLRKEGWSGVYEAGFKQAMHLYHLSGKDVYAEAAWKFSEAAKSAALLTSVNRLDPETLGAVPEAELREERRLRTRLALLSESHGDGDLNADERKELLAKRLQLDSLIERYARKYPKYAALRYDPEIPDLDAVRSALPDHGAVIAFLFGDEAVYGIAVLPGEVRIRDLGSSDSISRQINGFVGMLSNRPEASGFAGHSAALRAKGQLLFNDLAGALLEVEVKVKKMVIIPDGPLHYLPFEALTVSDAQGEHYLVELTDLSYAHSYTALTYATAPEVNYKGNFLGLAPRFDGGGGWPKLNEAKREINQAAALIAGSVTRDSVINSDWFFESAGQFRILHFATHAFADRSDPLNSALLLDGGAFAGVQGVLRARNLYAMNLTADLVVLSACNTGDGPVRKGEGVMSLAHAFAHAGSPAAIVSLWPANDVSVSRLTEKFYSGLTSGMSKSAAVSAAKRDYLSSADAYTAHPYFWAGMIFIGNDDPIPFEGRGTLLLFLAAAALVGVISALLMQKFAGRKK